MTQAKLALLKQISFGHRIAEEEAGDLSRYFVETDQWKRIFSGEIDIVYGAKGSGKSAIYALLIARENELFDRGIITVAAENVRGAPAFRDLVVDPPMNQREFMGLWKLYLLSLVGQKLREFDLRSSSSKRVQRELEEAGLLPVDGTLQKLLRATLQYARKILSWEAAQGTLELDQHTGLPVGVTAKITFRELSAEESKKGLISINELFSLANEALHEAKLSLWLMLDRLDVAFADTEELEKNALRALFQTYLDLRANENIVLKIFLRTDIWKRITLEGFREASHVTRHLTISWDESSLLNLTIRRLLSLNAITSPYHVNPGSTLADIGQQRALFYRIYPNQVDIGERKPTTFDWMLSRTSDGFKRSAPRELVHLLNSIREVQIRKLENGDEEPPDELLFARTSIKEGLSEVSTTRLTQTLYAEYPQYKDLLDKLRGEKSEQYASTLAKIWGLNEEAAGRLASSLVDIGFFERRGTKDDPIYWVPFLYRDALSLVQGAAEQV